MSKYIIILLLTPTLVFSQISYNKKKGCQSINSINFKSYFPPPGNQGKTYTCLGWALVYGLMSYDINKDTGRDLSKLNLNNYSQTKDPIIFSPTYNFGGINDYCKGVTAISMFKSIAKRGVSVYKPNKIISNDCSFDISGEKLQKFNFKQTDFNLFRPHNEDKGFTSDELINHLDCFGPFVLDITNHAMLCVGYNKSAKNFMLINSQNSEEAKNYCEKSFSDLKDIKLIISIKDKDEKKAIIYSEMSENNFQLDSNNFIIGNPRNPDTTKEKIWWLGKPSIELPWKHKRYYYTQHFENFCISVLKLGCFNSKAIIGVYDKHRKTLIYTFKIEPEDEVKFMIDEVTYDFKYIKKSFNQGVFFYPEINYTIMKSENKTNNN